MGQPLGAIVFGDKRAALEEGFVDHLAVSVPQHRGGAGVDHPGHVKLVSQAQDVAGAGHVDRFGSHPIGAADSVPAGDVKDDVAAGHAFAHRFAVGDVPIGDRGAHDRQFGRAPLRAGQAGDFVTTL